ncbi:MAG TPA: GNAT family N-acetyltransferase [Candidatus Sulfotelmatobacter sp.]|nr:GNAT family N-acetyltransferase [Candidatus Sulfotelmatobacter sp.]
MLEGGHGSAALDEIVLNRDFRGRVTGLAYFGMQLVIAADDDAAIDAIAVEARKHRALRSFVGPKDAVDGLWQRVRVWHAQPAIVRAEQPLYVLSPETLADEPDVDVRHAREDEALLIADHSGAMILGELGYDPRVNGGYTAGVRRAIAHGIWWVWIDAQGELRFQCNVGPRTRATAQIQGVWTPPDRRGHGYASLALAAIARRLFATEATLSLYVNDFNTAAIALYERLGFTRVGTFATYLFP